MVADAFSRKSFSVGSFPTICIKEQHLAKDVYRLANGLIRL